MRVPGTDEKDLAVLAQAIRELAAGGTNARGTVTLTPSATSTVVSNKLASESSMVVLSPRTASAAAAAPGIFVSAKANGSFTLGHASSTATDQNFEYEVRR